MSAVTRKMSRLPHEQLPHKRNYTYEEWVELERPEEAYKLELINGELYAMASPTHEHQGMLSELSAQFTVYLRGKKCKIYPGFGVRLAKNTVYIPDLILVCDKSKLTSNSHEGPPELIIEILSPSNRRHDNVTKFNAYLNAEVPEYWTVDPSEKFVARHRLVNGGYMTSTYEIGDTVPVDALPGFEIDLTAVFEYEFEEVEELSNENADEENVDNEGEQNADR